MPTNNQSLSHTEIESPDSEPWLTTAYRAYQNGDAAVQEFASQFIDEHIRVQLTQGGADVVVQEGLTYDPDVDELVDEFVICPHTYGLSIPAEAFGFEQMVLEGSAVTYDTAQVTDTLEDPGIATPSFESTVWARCELGFRAQIAQVVRTDISCRVYAPQATPADDD